MQNSKSLKDVLSKEEYERVSARNIDSTIGSLKHEGYKDDGFLRDLLRKLDRGEITEAQYDALLREHIGLK